MNPGRAKKRKKQDEGDDNRDWVGELETMMNTQHNMQPVYSVVRRHHLFTSLRDDQCQVTIQFGDKENSFMTQRARDHRMAEKICARSTCQKLQKLSTKGKTQNQQAAQIKVIGTVEGWCAKCGIRKPTGNFCHLCGGHLQKSSVHQVPGVRPNAEGIPRVSNMGTNAYEVIHNCEKYMSQDVLAALFKQLLHFISTRIKDIEYEFQTELCEDDNGFIGYRSTLVYNSSTDYQSVGVMVDENQAEESAAEACLRDQGYLPSKPRLDYTIQPYDGGVPYKLSGCSLRQPNGFNSHLYSDLLDGFCKAFMLGLPVYYGKKGECKRHIVPLTPWFKPEEVTDCLCWIGGKEFNSPFPHTLRVARQFTALAALQHFGVSRPQERMELRKYVHVNKYNLAQATTQYSIDHRPALKKGWVHPRFWGPDVYGEDGAQELISSGMIRYIVHEANMSTAYLDKLVWSEFNSSPALRGHLLNEMTDISVAKVHSHNPNLFVIGNTSFSINMLTDGGKIYCRKQKTYKEVCPGHHLQRLRCEYRVSIPSLEIHVKGVECEDITPVVPPLPVVTSCGVVVLYHDHEAGCEDVYVLLTQQLSGVTFEASLHSFVALLRGLLQPWENPTTTVGQVTQGMPKWLFKEIALLSEMTLSSVRTLVGSFCDWDAQWDRLFTQEKLPRQLRDIQKLCSDELARRKRKGIFDEEDRYAEQWHLPSTPFLTNFTSVGIHQEDSLFCARRALNETTGCRVTINEIEGAPCVDIFKNDNKNGAATTSRFYIMTDIYKGKVPNTRHKEMSTKGYSKYPDLKCFGYELSGVHYLYKTHEKLMQDNEQLCETIHFRNADGTRTKFNDAKPIKKKMESKKRTRREAIDGDDEEDFEAEEEQLNELDETIEDEGDEFNDEYYDDGSATSEEIEVMKRRREKIQRHYEAKRTERQRLQKGGDDLPPRDMFRHHTVWKRLDEAVNVCPMLAKVVKTSQFVERLKKVVGEADTYMRTNRMGKTVKTSLLWKL